MAGEFSKSSVAWHSQHTCVLCLVSPWLHVDSEETSHEIKAPEPEEHGQLPRVNAHFGPLHVVQLGTAATLSDVNHANSPRG